MFRHLLQEQGHEMVDVLIHSRIVVFVYMKCSFSLVKAKICSGRSSNNGGSRGGRRQYQQKRV